MLTHGGESDPVVPRPLPEGRRAWRPACFCFESPHRTRGRRHRGLTLGADPVSSAAASDPRADPYVRQTKWSRRSPCRRETGAKCCRGIRRGTEETGATPARRHGKRTDGPKAGADPLLSGLHFVSVHELCPAAPEHSRNSPLLFLPPRLVVCATFAQTRVATLQLRATKPSGQRKLFSPWCRSRHRHVTQPGSRRRSGHFHGGAASSRRSVRGH